MSEKSPTHQSNIEMHRLHRDVLLQTQNIFNWESSGQGRDDLLLRYAEWDDEATGARLRLDERARQKAPFRLSVSPDSLHRSQSKIDYYYGGIQQYVGKISNDDERTSSTDAAREILDHLQTFQTLSPSERTEFDEFAAEEVALDMKRTVFVARALAVAPRFRQRYIQSAVSTRAEREQLNPLLIQHYLTMATWQ